MNQYISIRDQICPNKRCAFYGKRLENNVIAHSRQYPRFKCKACGKTWSAYKNDLRYGLKKDFEQFETAIGLLQKGFSVRKTAQGVGVSPGTIQRWKFRFLCKNLTS